MEKNEINKLIDAIEGVAEAIDRATMLEHFGFDCIGQCGDCGTDLYYNNSKFCTWSGITCINDALCEIIMKEREDKKGATT